MRQMKAMTAAAMMCVLAGPVFANSLSINPGMWESTIVTTTPFAPQPQTTTSTECVEDTNFDPESFPGMTEECTVSSKQVSGNTLDWTMTCTMQGGMQSTMTGRMTSYGDSGTGEMQMQMSMGGQTFNMQSTMNMRRLGDC